jgi:hypothetical protein
MWKRGNFSFSNTSTFRPAFRNVIAAVDPAGPPPMMMTSQLVFMMADEVPSNSREARGMAQVAKNG